MDKSIFLKLFQNKYLCNLIFNNVRHIFIDILKAKKTFKWNEVKNSETVLAGNGYIDLLRQHFATNNRRVDIYEPTPIIQILKSKQLSILKFYIEELKLDITTKFQFNYNDIIQHHPSYNTRLMDFYTLVSRLGSVDTIKYLDIFRNIQWDYVEAYVDSPLSGDIDLVKLMNTKLNKKKPLTVPALQDALCNAASIGRLDILQQILKDQQHLQSTTFMSSLKNDLNMVKNSIKGGNMDILKLFVVFPINIPILDHMAMYNRFEMMQWAHRKTTDTICSHEAMKNAALNGNLEMIKWLHENRTEGCTLRAMDWAASKGNLEVVKWLHENRTEGCSTYAFNWAADSGHLEMVKWLHHNRTEGCTINAMDGAASNGHCEVLKWLNENRTEGCSTNAMNWAVMNGHLDAIKWLHYNRTEGCTIAIDHAAEFGHLEVIKWLHENRTEGCSINAMNKAAEFGHLEVFKWLHENRTEGCTSYALKAATNNNQYDVISWINNNLNFN